MNDTIYNLLRTGNTAGKLALRYIAQQLHAEPRDILETLMTMRREGKVKSWGSGTMYMRYWSVA